jgi:diaminopimelate decarboxylase/aspartate kinase
LADKWIVLKFGGTSVAGRPQWDAIVSLVKERRASGFKVLLVCSAVAGVTNRLTRLADSRESEEPLAELLEIHRALGRDLEVDEQHWLARAESALKQCLADLRQDTGPRSRAALLAMGEWLSTRIALHFLRKELEVHWVDARDALKVVCDEELSPARQWLSASCPAGEDPALQKRWSGLSPVLITQGFIGRAADGGTALLGRGGSDTSAALLAGRLNAQLLEIWTDVPGLFSADPRLVPGARLLSELDYDEALEMAASGARVIHPRCIRAAAASRTPVVIRDLKRQQLIGTRIGVEDFWQEGVKTITCQENMAVMLLQNLDARQQVGFLAGVFDIIRCRGISVDLVATSETTTTVALNCEANHLDPGQLEALADDLASLCHVRLHPDCVCVNLVGHGARTALSRLQQVLRFFDDHPLLMVSQSANDLCLSLLVQAGDHLPLLHGAHAALVPEDSARGDGVFGVSWDQLTSQSGDI